MQFSAWITPDDDVSDGYIRRMPHSGIKSISRQTGIRPERIRIYEGNAVGAVSKAAARAIDCTGGLGCEY